jgi:hypothetical protein
MCGDNFIIRHYEPLRGLQFTYDIEVTAGVSERLAAAIERTWKSTDEIWHPQSLWVVQSILESALRSVRWAEIKRGPEAPTRHIRLYRAVSDLIKSTNRKVANYQTLQHAVSLFEEGKSHNHNTISSLMAEIAVEALTSLSNEFEGVDDRHWIDAHEIMRALFPSIGSAPDGLSPVQHAAIKLIQEKLRENMKGYYPALTRLLLPLIGPYRSHHQPNRTAFCILEDIAYFEWKNFAQLSRKHPDKLAHFLPPSVSYDAANDALVHSYRSGDTRTTILSGLTLHELNLDDPSLRQSSPDQAALEDG